MRSRSAKGRWCMLFWQGWSKFVVETCLEVDDLLVMYQNSSNQSLVCACTFEENTLTGGRIDGNKL